MAQRYHSVFDIIGPVMVGPSSSHTAGAARIGKVVQKIFGATPAKVDIFLYESFAKTYRGHGTDIALVGGLLGMDPADERLADSIEIAKELGIEINFIPTNEKAEHPNSVKLVVSTPEKSLSVVGISIGGGKIQISEVNGFIIQLEENQPTFLIVHQDVPGMIAQVSNILAEKAINIGTMTVSRESKGQQAIMMIEVDQYEVGETLAELKQVEHIKQASFFK